MALEIKKHSNEPSPSLVRRFTQRLRQSGILREVLKKQFKKRKKSWQLKKRAALRRLELKGKYEKMKKMGKLCR